MGILVLTCAVACRKEKNNNSGPVYTMYSAFTEVAPKEMIQNIEAATGGSFRGNSGSRYIIPANAFVNSAGTIITGTVQIHVTEYLRKADMLFSGIIPISNGAPLISGGEVYITANQFGNRLWLAPGKTFQVNMPQGGTPAAGMFLFTGQKDSAANTVNWIPVPDSTLNGRKGIVYNGDTLGIISDSIGYCNADQFMTSPNYQSFTVTATTANGAPINNSICGYALYDNYNGLWQMYASNKVFSENHVPDIPVHFVVTCIIDGDLYGGILGATPANGATYNVVLSKTTPAQLRTQVDAL